MGRGSKADEMERTSASSSKKHSGKRTTEPGGKIHSKRDSSAPRTNPPRPANLLDPMEEMDFPRGKYPKVSLDTAEAPIQEQPLLEVEDVAHDNEETGKSATSKKRKASTTSPRKASKSSKKSEQALAAGSSEPAEAKIRIEHLNAKRMVKGMLLLGRVSEIHPLALIVSLPNMLEGHVPITAINDLVTQRLEEDAEEEADPRVPALEEMFKPGQILPLQVTALHAGNYQAPTGRSTSNRGRSTTHNASRIEMTANPRLLNERLSKADLVPGFTIIGYIKSKEDHGYIVDLGLKGVQGFIAAIKPEEMNLLEGSPIVCTVVKPPKGRTVSLVPCRKGNCSAVKTPLGSIDAIKPGLLVEATITGLSSDGARLQFLKFYAGTADLYHYGTTDHEKLVVGETVLARVIYEVIDEQKRFALSLQSSLLTWNEDIVKEIREKYPIGQIVEHQTVARVDTEWGLISRLDPAQSLAFTHISDVSDDHIVALSSDSGKYCIGTKHKARVTGYAVFNELVVTSMAPSVLKQSFMQISELAVGAMIRGTVKSLTPQSMFVDVGGACDAIVWTRHLSDVVLKKPERKYRPGMTVRGRIFSIDPAKSRVVLTLRKSLIESENVIDDPGALTVGKVVDGVVTRVDDKGCSVELFSGKRAYVPIREASNSFTEKMSDIVSLAQMVSVRIISIDNESEQILGSLKPLSDISIRDAKKAARLEKGSKSGTRPALFVNPIDPSLVEMADCSAGRIIQVRIRSVKDTQLNVAIADNLSGRIHVSEVYDNLDEIKDTVKPLRSFHINQIVTARILGWTQVKRHDYLAITHTERNSVVLDLTMKPSEMKAEQPVSQRTVLDFNKGQKVLAFVNQVTLHELFVNVSPTVRGRVTTQRLTSDLAKLNSLNESYPAGAALQLVVESIDAEKDRLHLHATDFDCPIRLELSDFQVGDVLPGRVAGSVASGLLIQVTDNVLGRAHLTEITDEAHPKPLDLFPSNTFVHFKVIRIDKSNKMIDLSLRDSVIKSIDSVNGPQNLALLQVGQTVHGYVRHVSDTGLFVDLRSDVTARVKISQLFDNYVKDWKSQFVVGQMVSGTISSIDSDKKRVEMTLKTKPGDRSALMRRDVSSCKIGELVTGVVHAIEDYGVFLRIKGSALTGLCHKSECTDQVPTPPLSTLFLQGDELKAKIIKIDEVKKRISLSVKGSVLAQSLDEEAEKILKPSLNDIPMNDVEADTEEQVFSASESDNEVGMSPKSTAEPMIPDSVLALDRGFDWHAVPDDGIGAADLEELLPLETQTKDTSQPDDSRIREAEQEILTYPDRSIEWIKLMAVYAERGNLEDARAVARRAVATINHRKEDEKLNVWIALLNLELDQGTTDSLETTFRDAVAVNDPKETYLRHVLSLEPERHQFRIHRLLQEAVKKFKHSSKIWVAFGQHLFRTEQASEAGSALSRSLEVLPKRKHMKTILQFAQMEYKEAHGSVERGRTLFEGLVGRFPKRTDVWTVYIDMEMKAGDRNFARSLYERVLISEQQSSKVSTKAAKNLFKKWLAMEKEAGSAAKIEAVKAKARAFVEDRENAVH